MIWSTSSREPATGFSLFMDSVQRALPAPTAPEKVFLPAGTDTEAARALRADGMATVQGFEDGPGGDAEADALGCTHIFKDGTVHKR